MRTTQIPFCFYPTKVILIDDDTFFSQLIMLHLQKHTPCEFFSQPFAALDALKHYQARNLAETIVSPSTDSTQLYVDLQNIHHLLDHAERHEQITALLLDYQMPGINGVELAQKIKIPNAKKVLLTGEADASIAVDAFNQKLIDLYVRKAEKTLSQDLWPIVKSMQWDYFCDVTHAVINNFDHKAPIRRYLQSEALATQFRTFVDKENIKEFYLLDGEGNFLLIDQNDSQHQLALHDKQSLDQLSALAYQQYQEEPSEEYDSILKAIDAHQQVPLFDVNDEQPTLEEWEALMTPLQSWSSDDQPYFAAIKKL